MRSLVNFSFPLMFLLGITCAVMFSSAPQAPGESAAWAVTDSASAKEDMPVDTRRIIYFFTSDYCIPCRQMEPIVAEIKAEGNRIVTMRMEDGQWSKYVDYYQPAMTPTFVTVNSQGKELHRTVGTTTKLALLNEPSKSEAENFNAQPVIKNSGRFFYRPRQTAWFRGRSTRILRGSACGTGGCR